LDFVGWTLHFHEFLIFDQEEFMSLDFANFEVPEDMIKYRFVSLPLMKNETSNSTVGQEAGAQNATLDIVGQNATSQG